MKRALVAFVSGLLFAAGLCISGMTRPSKVIGFLDVAGAWDPSLALVMAGAIAVSAIAFRIAAKRAAPMLDDRFHVADRKAKVDGRLVAGAVLFGLGWGLSGLCPGPALLQLVTAQTGAIVFVGSMLVGMAVYAAAVRVVRVTARR